jgi:light-regulated signal transduction histidine kinase (bacteriophytochrome)
LLHKSDNPWPNCPFEETKKDNKSHTREINDPHIGVPLLVTTSPIFDDNGEFIASVHIAKDIAERKEVEEELKRYREHLEELVKERTTELKKSNKQLQMEITERKQAEESLEVLNKELEATVEKLTLSNRELQDFVHIAAHDLKTPLRGIVTLVDWISEDYGHKFDEQGKEQVKLLVKRAVRMSKLIDSIRQYSKVGRAKQKAEEVDLNTVLTEVIREIDPPENIEVTIESELPTVICERTSMLQVFQNLLSNSIKYMDKPHGWIKIACVEEDGFWKFSVADNGPGIEEKYFEKVFKMFQRLSLKDEFESVGIGLCLVKKVIEMYNGKIWVESEAGQGSTFFFTLPKQEMGVKDAKYEADTACRR